ncbi:MAG: hypothetical protein ACXQS8_05300 [Candidatus Helarchaeales archaeon]
MDSYEISLKNDIVPAIAEKLNRQVDPRKLFNLSIDALDLIFGYLFQDSNVGPSDIIEILNSTDDQDEILRRLHEVANEVTEMPEDYDEREDIIAGIMAGIIGDFIGHDLRNEIEKRLREEKDINKLIEYSQMSLNHLEIALGIRPPPYIPPEESDRAVPVPTPRVIHPDVPDEPIPPVTPLDEEPATEPSVPFVPSSPPPGEVTPDPTDPAQRVSTVEARREAAEIVRQRKERIKKVMDLIKKKLEKAKINLDEVAQDLEIVERVHPERLERMVDIMDKVKKKSRVKQIFDWLVVSQQIEEIEVLVTHWQGIVGGSGAFRAAIPFARYDAILPDLSPRELEQFIKRAKKAVYQIQNATDVNDRFIAVEEIKELGADFTRRAVYG